MKAAYLEGPGGPDVFVHGELPDPTPGPGEVLVRVRATTVNHVDTVWRSGIRPYFKLKPPHVLGSEAAGEVVAVGAGVTTRAVGDRVVATVRTGSYAELAVATLAQTALLPDSVSFEDGSGLASTGTTAYRMVVRRAALRPGDTVVVTAGASGTGSVIVQVAKAAGCRVIATAGGERKRGLVESIGADATIDHYTDDVAARILELTDGAGADAAIDAVSSQPLYDALIAGLRPGGRLVTYGNIAGGELTFNVRTLFSRGIELRGGQGGDPTQLAGERPADLAGVVALAAAGKVTMLRDRVVPLTEAGAAHAAMEAHEPAGKIILLP